jgi:AraC family transcriptional regulator, transcriptional activator of pobA
MKTTDPAEELTIHYNSFPDSVQLAGTIKPAFKNSHAIVWLKRGHGKYSVDFRQYTFNPNSIILISKDQNTAFEFSGKNDQYIVITFTHTMVSKSAPEIQQLVSFCIREHFEGKQILTVAPEDEKYLKGLTHQLLTIASHGESKFKSSSMFHFLQLILVYCYKLRTEQHRGTADTYTAVVGNFTTLLEKSFRNTHKVNYYTDNLNLTYNSLARYTTSYCSKTPKEIIVERVILEIKRLLSGTTLPVKEIAFQLGFDEPTNLIKYFRKYTGSTPAGFRAQQH